MKIDIKALFVLNLFYFFNCNNIKNDRFMIQNKSEFAKKKIEFNDSIELIVGNKKNIKEAKQKEKSKNYEEFYILNESFKIKFDNKNNEFSIIKGGKIYNNIEVRFVDGWTIDKFKKLNLKRKEEQLFVLYKQNEPEKSYVYIANEKLKGGCNSCYESCNVCCAGCCTLSIYGFTAYLYIVSILGKIYPMLSGAIGMNCLCCTICCLGLYQNSNDYKEAKRSGKTDLNCCCKAGICMPVYYVYAFCKRSRNRPAVTSKEKLDELIDDMYNKRFN